jgi:hypothetical protein
MLADIRGAHRSLVGKPERQRPFGKSWLRWDGNLPIYLKDLG